MYDFLILEAKGKFGDIIVIIRSNWKRKIEVYLKLRRLLLPFCIFVEENSRFFVFPKYILIEVVVIQVHELKSN